ncbi:MAG TPA: 30S ribosomal protein S9 [Candidatus Polarisedimenticolia bacterium]|nr:30S ribosomal protein S9 [Candidatus Polarisedimenticolia bacterium]
MIQVQYYATGRRKTATARVYLRPGEGKMTINRRELGTYFHTDSLKRIAKEPLSFLELHDKFDVLVNVNGGGETGQAGAIRHGLARALVVFDAGLKPRLKSAGFLTRDSRVKERKKYGQKGARARFQFSKR